MNWLDERILNSRSDVESSQRCVDHAHDMIARVDKILADPSQDQKDRWKNTRGLLCTQLAGATKLLDSATAQLRRWLKEKGN